MMCGLLAVSRSGFYAWLQRKPSSRSGDERLAFEIQTAHRAGRGTYGSPRVVRELRARGLHVGRHRVARLMRQQGLRGTPERRFRVTTTTDPSLAVASNQLARRFDVGAVDEVWGSDLTYLWTAEGWLYLAVVMDLCSRRVIGWSLGTDLGSELPLRALRMALGQRSPARLHHSDRGCQYASASYRSELSRCRIACSMSRRGDCWDNAPVESFFATLKRELVYRSGWRTRAEARADIFDYIEAFYNRTRRHSALGYLSPAQFETQLRAA
jgi:putative transposase